MTGDCALTLLLFFSLTTSSATIPVEKAPTDLHGTTLSTPRNELEAEALASSLISAPHNLLHKGPPFLSRLSRAPVAGAGPQAWLMGAVVQAVAAICLLETAPDLKA